MTSIPQKETLIVDGLSLRPILISDAPALLKIAEHPVMQSYLRSEGYTDSIETFIADYFDPQFATAKHWVILRGPQPHSEPIGIVDLYPTSPESKPKGMNDAMLSVGVWVHPRLYRQGIATKSLACVMEQTFQDKPELNWLQASCQITNVASRALLEGLDFKFYEAMPFRGQIDVCYLRHRHPTFAHAKITG